MVVMLRSIGIPARFVVGYGSDTYNTITGYYEVQANDAHAWVEVFFPGYEWVVFDPTPGWTGNPESGLVQTWPLSNLFAGLDLPSLPLGQVFEAGVAAFGIIGGPLILLVLIAVTAFGALRFWRWWTRRHICKQLRRIFYRDPAREPIYVAYRNAQRQLKSFREQSQTAQEHAAVEPQLQELASLVDIAAYRPQPPESSLIERARAWRQKRS